MDPSEIVTAATKVGQVAAASVPFTAIVKRMLGPAADEVAEMWRDQVRLYRYERQLKCVEKAERMAKEAGFTPKAVPPKILFPLLEGASMEEDEMLHDMWAALLANAASRDGAGLIRPSILASLRQMASDEARLLNWIVSIQGDVMTSEGIDLDTLSTHYRSMRSWKPRQTGDEALSPQGYEQAMEFALCVDCLKTHGLIHKQGSEYYITTLGYSLVRLCSAPKMGT